MKVPANSPPVPAPDCPRGYRGAQHVAAVVIGYLGREVASTGLMISVGGLVVATRLVGIYRAACSAPAAPLVPELAQVDRFGKFLSRKMFRLTRPATHVEVQDAKK